MCSYVYYDDMSFTLPPGPPFITEQPQIHRARPRLHFRSLFRQPQLDKISALTVPMRAAREWAPRWQAIKRMPPRQSGFA